MITSLSPRTQNTGGRLPEVEGRSPGPSGTQSFDISSGLRTIPITPKDRARGRVAVTIQDQYTSTVRQTRETWAEVIESFTNDLQKAFGQSVTPFGPVDPNAAIDQVFDFWGKTLEVQRDFAKKLAGVTVAVGETVRSQVESVGETVRAQAESAQEAAREEAAAEYEDLTKAELQQELARRDLPKTGNVDELRERLIEDDQK
jgi:SAP domain